MKRKLLIMISIGLLFTSCNAEEMTESSAFSLTSSMSEELSSSSTVSSFEQESRSSSAEPINSHNQDSVVSSPQVKQEKVAEISTRNSTPQDILTKDPNADFFVVNSLICVNASDLDWVQKESLSTIELIGTIQRTTVKPDDNWAELDATILPIGTEIYATERFDICLVKVDIDYVRYLKWIEG